MSNNKKILVGIVGLIAAAILAWLFVYELDIFGYFTIVGEPTVGTAKVN